MSKIALAMLALAGCAGERSAYMTSGEQREICHLAYQMSRWEGQDKTLPLWIVYRDHIGMHPNDYWGRCRPEDLAAIEENAEVELEQEKKMDSRRKKQ